jgi:hypothetical protein
MERADNRGARGNSTRRLKAAKDVDICRGGIGTPPPLFDHLVGSDQDGRSRSEPANTSVTWL